jgi:hypothetical protein
MPRPKYPPDPFPHVHPGHCPLHFHAMRRLILCMVLAIINCLGVVRADATAQTPEQTTTQTDCTADAASLKALDPQPIYADDDLTDQSIYANPTFAPSDQDVNAGAVHLDLHALYADNYVYRGIDHDAVAKHGNSLNLLLDGLLSFDLGKYPHPFVGLFADIYDSDPVSRFQEFRPYVGATWDLRPFLLEGGDISYIYPERDSFDTAEVYAKVTLDDSWFMNTEKPFLSPYFYGAYNYQLAKGWYLEIGVHHDIEIPDWGLKFTVYSAVGYISSYEQQFIYVNTVQSNGWQHVDFGLTASYSLNSLLNVSKRYGEFDLQGFMEYDGKLNPDITGNNLLWGGGGIGFKY